MFRISPGLYALLSFIFYSVFIVGLSVYLRNPVPQVAEFYMGRMVDRAPLPHPNNLQWDIGATPYIALEGSGINDTTVIVYRQPKKILPQILKYYFSHGFLFF